MSFKVAILGRPNVGKSTLFNRLTSKRTALVHDEPGVTRDRREGNAQLGSLEFTIIDTAGLEEAPPETLAGKMTAQTGLALKEADVAMFVIDGRAGVTPEDKHFAKWLRKSEAKVVLVVNKAEGNAAETAVAEAYRLGFGDPIPVSAEHGEGLFELAEALAPYAREDAPEEDEDSKEGLLHLAIIGRPNVGKSTLTNALLGEERSLVSDIAGTTRDAVTVMTEWQERPLRLVDTAGLRKKARVVDSVESLAVGDAIRALKFADVAIMVMSAEAPLEKQDNAIAALAEREGRAVVIALNKWDIVDDEEAWLKAFNQRLSYVLPQLKGAAVVPISAQNKKGLPRLMKEVFKTYDRWNTRVSTGKLNRWLKYVTERHTPPIVDGTRLKLRYITQAKARPPTFTLFCNKGGKLPMDYQRYLTHSLREEFDLPGIPIRLLLRKGENPYA